MTNEEAKEKLDAAALKICEARELVQEVRPYIAECKKKSDYLDTSKLLEIITDLTWADENCTVIGLHQIGKALSDTMGG